MSDESQGEWRSDYVVSRGVLPSQWVNGAPNEAALQCHCLDERTWIFRFSKWQGVVHSGKAEYQDAYEGNFCFCFIGDAIAVLWDTGPVPRSALKAALESLLPSPGTLDLVIAHTHSHDDHVAGDCMWNSAAPSPFKSIRIVGHAPSAVIDFFAVPPAPSSLPCEGPSLETAQFDLGGRALELFHIPGHEPAAIAVYDPITNILVTGDNLYPGRCDAVYNVQHAAAASRHRSADPLLCPSSANIDIEPSRFRFVPFIVLTVLSRLYVRDAPAFTASAVRMAAFVERLGATLASSLRVLGCHIEMTSTAGVDYPTGTLHQPCEAPYALTAEHVADVAFRCVTALGESDNGTLPRIVCDRYIIEPVAAG